MRRRYYTLLWLPPLMLHSLDAHAWGLLTHVYFAQWLLWTLPLADPELRRAAQRFPRLVLAGACLPDLSLVSPAFRHSHQWEHVRAMVQAARSDEETAVAIGYASHLLVDVVAHNHFVPAHEAMWLQGTLLTHVLGEWAVDAHIAPLADATPHAVLAGQHALLAPLMARRFRCTGQRASDAIRRLATADRMLRTARLPQVLYRTFRSLDRRVFRHFIYYVSQTQDMLRQLDAVLDGALPAWEADPRHAPQAWSALRLRSLRHLRERHPEPLALFQPGLPVHTSQNDISAIIAPMAAPASTSLG